uniref:Methyltransferase n=1 Tax=viral metagenome TaxID=1070528 RepID=A0A6C0LQI7_9ZZZZ
MTTIYILGHGRSLTEMRNSPLVKKQYALKTKDASIVYVDRDPAVSPDLCFDVCKTWLSDSASVDTVIDTVGPDNYIFFSNPTFVSELKRVLKPGGEYIGYVMSDKLVENLQPLEKQFKSVSTFQNVPIGMIGIKLIN